MTGRHGSEREKEDTKSEKGIRVEKECLGKSLARIRCLCGYPVSPTPFIQETVLFPLYVLVVN